MDEYAFVKGCLDNRDISIKYYLSTFIGKGGYGSVYKLCKNTNKTKCKYVLKVISDTEFFDREVRNQNKCSELLNQSFVYPVVDSWICNKQGILITKYLPISFKNFLLSTDHIGKKMCIIHKIILNIYDMHVKCSIVHQDFKLENIMMDDHGKPFFIDFGLSFDMDHPEDKLYYQEYAEEDLADTGLSYLKIVFEDYKLFLDNLAEFINSLPNEYMLKDFVNKSTLLFESEYNNEIKNIEEDVSYGKSAEKTIIDAYKKFINVFFE